MRSLSHDHLRALAGRRVFFGHQSVGRDIMAGVRRIVAGDADAGVSVVESVEPSRVDGPAIIEGRLGRNREPASKDDAFEAALADGFGDEPGAIAMYKYCYVDLLAEGDPERLFARYVECVDSVQRRHPGITLVHFTMPLQSAPTGLGERLRTRLGRATQTAANERRNRYNELVRERFASAPLFDVALLESTRPDGSAAYTRAGHREVPMLASEWTEDGGHLVPAAQDRLAEQLLATLARLSES